MEGLTSPEHVQPLQHSEQAPLARDTFAAEIAHDADVSAMRQAVWKSVKEGLAKKKDLRSVGADLATLCSLTGERISEQEERRVVDALKEQFHHHLERGDGFLAAAVAADAANISEEKFLAELSDQKREELKIEMRKFSSHNSNMSAARMAADFRTLFGEGAVEKREEVILAQTFAAPIQTALKREDFAHAATYAADRKILLGESVVK